MEETGRKIWGSKIVKFSPSKSSFYHMVLIVPPHLDRIDSATLPTPNERDPNSCAVKMHRKEKKRRGKWKRQEEKFADLIAKKKKKSVRIDFSVVTPAPWPFMSLTWMAYTTRKPVVSTFFYRLDIIDQLHRLVSKRKYQTPPPFLLWFSKPLAVERICSELPKSVH